MIVFGGSVADAHRFYEASMLEGLKDFPYPNSIRNLQIEFSTLENAGILGACVSLLLIAEKRVALFRQIPEEGYVFIRSSGCVSNGIGIVQIISIRVEYLNERIFFFNS